MFRIAILTRPYIVPYTSYAGQDKMDIQYNNFAGIDPVNPIPNRGINYFRYSRTYSGRPLGQQ